jgi:peptidyl-prolyl cis-trans isomerase SurA
LLSDLRDRARPILIQLYERIPAGPQRAAAESKILSELIERIVDEELEALVAARDSVRVSAEEVDKAMRNIARASGMPLAKLMENIHKDTGMTEVEYRQEIRRQVLEGKLLQRMVQNQRVTEKELREIYERVVRQERRILLYNPAWIVLKLDPKAPAAEREQQMLLANEIVRRARAGEAFADLAAQYSQDPTAADNGGDLGIRAVEGSQPAMSGRYKRLSEDLERKALTMDVNEVSDPFKFRDALVVMQIISRQPSNYTSFESARGEMFERVRNEKMQRVKKKWLRDLRRRSHVDVRL